MTPFSPFSTSFILRWARLWMILAVLTAALVALPLSMKKKRVPLLLFSCILFLSCLSSTAEFAPTSLGILILSVIVTTTCVDVIYWFLFYRCCWSSDWNCFHFATMFNTFSRRIAHSYASWGLRVWAICSATIVSLCICAVNMSLTHSSSLSPQSALKASWTKSARKCSRLSVLFYFLKIRVYLSKATILVVTK